MLFDPTADYFGNGSITIQAAVGTTEAGEFVTVLITIVAENDGPNVEIGPNIYRLLPADSNSINIQFVHTSIADIDDDTTNHTYYWEKIYWNRKINIYNR